MSVKLQTRSAEAKQAYVLVKAIEQLLDMRNGVTSSYGAEQCNRLLATARQLAADDPEILNSLQSLQELQFRPGRGLWLAAEAQVFLAELKGMLLAFINLHMSPKERERLGI